MMRGDPENWGPWPKGLTRATLNAVPKRHRKDAFQVAWVALAEGRHPNRAVQTYCELEHLFDNRKSMREPEKQNQ